MKSKRGITLITLIITVVVLLIIASIATYSGIDIIKSSKFTAFSTELKIMQTQVNNIYQKYKDNNTITIDGVTYYGETEKDNQEKQTILEIGEELTGDIQTQADKVFTELASDTSTGITSQDGYRYWSNELIKKLGIEGVEGKFFVNVEKRSILSYEGFEYEGEMYYTVEQLPEKMYNVEYVENTNVPTFSYNITNVEQNKWKINITDIQYDGYIEKWQVKYKKQGWDYWAESDNLSFLVEESGQYIVQLVNGDIKSDEKGIKIVGEIEYETEGLLMYCDSQESNIYNTTNDTIKIWNDLSGNNNNITLNNVKINEDKSLSAIDNTTYGENEINISGNNTIEVVARYDTTDIGYLYALQQDEDNYFYLWNYSNSGATFSYRYKSGEQYDVFDNITDETSIQGKMYTISIAFNENEKVAKIYINGVYNKSVTFSYYTALENVKILILNSLTGDRPLIGGSIYSIRVYEKELTEEQIGNNFTVDQEKYDIE